MTNPSQTNENSSGYERLDEELQSWAQVVPEASSTNLSSASLIERHGQRRSLRRISSIAVACLLVLVTWMLWPAASTEQVDLANNSDNDEELERLRAEVERTIGEIALLQNQSEFWQRTSLYGLDATTTQPVRPLGHDSLTEARASTLELDDEHLNAQWQAARRQTALSQTLDQWLAVHP